MSNEEKKFILEKLKNLEREADTANSAMNAFEVELGGVITDFAFKHFPALNEMSADDIRRFGQIISKHAWSLTLDLDALHYDVKNK